MSYGNDLDVDFVELVDYLGDDPNTSIIGAYVEDVRCTFREFEGVGVAAIHL